MKKNLNKKNTKKKKEKKLQPVISENSKKASIDILKDVKEKKEDLERSRGALMNILEDVEDARKKAEQEKNKTLSIITNLSDGLLFFNKENNLSLINPQAEEFLKVESKEVVGKTILELKKITRFFLLINLLKEFFTIKTIKNKRIKEIFRKELKLEEKLILEVSTVPILRKEKKLGILVILHNITREKLIEKMKTEFVSIAAHQLRTPLSAIKWTLKMLLDEDLGKINQQQKDFIEKTYISNERMIALINDLLNITRIEEGKFLYKATLTQIENIVQLVINSNKERIKKKKIIFEFKIPKQKLPKVLVDIEKINLAIQNLLDNAIRYTPIGGKMTISINNDKKKIEFSIKDTGMGIPKNQQKRVFTKFFRASNVIKTDTEGSGLGLFIAKNIIESHNGKIWFESEQEKGTTFHFTLPIKK